jgi:drug/metabolite transporter, DME family
VKPAPRRRSPGLAAAFVLAAASFWATFGIFARRLYEAGFEPMELASTRAAVGFLALVLLTLGRRTFARAASPRGRPGSTRPAPRGGVWSALPPWRDAAFLAVYGVLGYAAFTLVFLRSLEANPVAVAVALLYTAPGFVVLMSALLWRERIGVARLTALVLVLSGVLLVTGAAGALLRGTAALPPASLLLGVASGATYAVYTMFSRVATLRFGAGPALVWSFGFATAAFALLAPPWGPFLRMPAQAPTLLALGIVPTLIPYALYLAALRELRASTAAMLASAEPVVAALLAALLLSERMDLIQGAGMALVVAAAILLAREIAAPAEDAAHDSGGAGRTGS